LTFSRYLGFLKKSICVYVCVGKVWDFFDLPRITENKKFKPFLYKISQNSKIWPQIRTAALLFIGPFWAMRPNNRQVNARWDIKHLLAELSGQSGTNIRPHGKKVNKSEPQAADPLPPSAMCSEDR
jgi:hypothetical protein